MRVIDVWNVKYLSHMNFTMQYVYLYRPSIPRLRLMAQRRVTHYEGKIGRWFPERMYVTIMQLALLNNVTLVKLICNIAP